MPETFELVDIFIIIGISQGVLLSFTLWRITNNNRKANVILCTLLLIATIMLAGRFVFFRFLNNWIFQWSLWIDTIIFLFGPQLYTYIRRLLFSDPNGYKLPIQHYFPAIGMVIISCFSVILYSPDVYFAMYETGKLNLFFKSLMLCGIVSNSYYLYHSLQLLQNFKNKEKQCFSFEQNPISFLHFFLLSIAVFICAWIFNFFNFSFSFISYDSVWATISIFIYVVGYFNLKQPEVFQIQLEPKPKEKKERLSKTDTAILKTKMEDLMRTEKPFLRANFTMKDLADKLQTSTNNISWLLNTVYNLNFYDFINEYRIKEFIAKVQKKEYVQRTILGLSKDVGFKSKSTFYKAFKLSTNETPSSFIKKHQN